MRSNVGTLADVIVAPAAAAEAIAESRGWMAPACVTLALCLCGGLLSLHNQALVARATLSDVIVSAVMAWSGATLWAFLCFLAVAMARSVASAPRTAMALAAYASIALIGVPLFIEGAVTAIAAFAYGTPVQQTQFLLPSLGWIAGGSSIIMKSLFAKLNIFLLLQIYVFAEFLRPMRLTAPIRWLLAVVFAALPQIIWIAITVAMFSAVSGKLPS